MRRSFLPVWAICFFGIVIIPRFLAASPNFPADLPAEFAGGVGGNRIYAVSELAGAQAKIDDAYWDIFRTPTGKKWVSEFFHNDPLLLARHFGISDAAAERIVQTCGGLARFLDHACSVAHGDPLEQVEQGPLRLDQDPRRYGFVFPSKGSKIGPYDSYTYVMNSTLIALPSRDFTKADLYPILIHELAIYLDQKSVIDPRWDAITNHKDKVSFSNEKYSVYDAVNNPIIHHAVAAIRGYAVEKKILSELGRDDLIARHPEYRLLDFLSSPKGCMDSVNQVMKVLMTDAEGIWRSSVVMRWSDLGITVGMLEPSGPELLGKIKSQTASDLALIGTSEAIRGNERESLCTFLTRPEVGTDNTRTSYGPRPRAEPW